MPFPIPATPSVAPPVPPAGSIDRGGATTDGIAAGALLQIVDGLSGLPALWQPGVNWQDDAVRDSQIEAMRPLAERRAQVTQVAAQSSSGFLSQPVAAQPGSPLAPARPPRST